MKGDGRGVLLAQWRAQISPLWVVPHLRRRTRSLQGPWATSAWVGGSEDLMEVVLARPFGQWPSSLPCGWSKARGAYEIVVAVN